jgi:uncharacterized protein (TIGR02246 family)
MIVAAGLVLAANNPLRAADTAAAEKEIRERSTAFTAAFNERDVAKLAELFAPDAELVDDAGVTHTGREAIQNIFSRFFEAYPEARMDLTIESIRFASGGVAIEDGIRTVTAADGEDQATNRYMAIHVKRGDQWQVAAAREVPEDPQPTPHDHLESLSWLVGTWVDEDAEAAISIHCRWDENENFLLVDFIARKEGQTVMNSRQRIGWDPLCKRVRSWVFDSDGGYGDGHWTEVDGTWIIKSTAVLPDGTTGSATIFIEPINDDRFVMKGFDRVLGRTVEPDFEALVVRQPPQPSE